MSCHDSGSFGPSIWFPLGVRARQLALVLQTVFDISGTAQFFLSRMAQKNSPVLASSTKTLAEKEVRNRILHMAMNALDGYWSAYRLKELIGEDVKGMILSSTLAQPESFRDKPLEPTRSLGPSLPAGPACHVSIDFLSIFHLQRLSKCLPLP